ncbi:MAG: flagellar basal body-associated FliL family protein [bacterium]|nr:flagellar basal body-associated FliL family protein [bacterium]
MKVAKLIKSIVVCLVVVAAMAAYPGGAYANSGAGGGGSEEGEFSMLSLETFIVNLKERGSLLKVKMDLVMDPEAIPEGLELKKFVAPIRNEVIYVISNKTAEDVLSSAGKEKVREEIKHRIDKLLGGEMTSDIYFTEFVVQ